MFQNKLYELDHCTCQFLIFFLPPVFVNYYSKLPQLLVICLTAAFFDGANSDLDIYLFQFSLQFLSIQFGHLIFYLKVVFAHQHFGDALFIQLSSHHLPNFLSNISNMLEQTLKWFQSVLKYSLRKTGQQLYLFSDASHIQIIRSRQNKPQLYFLRIPQRQKTNSKSILSSDTHSINAIGGQQTFFGGNIQTKNVTPIQIIKQLEAQINIQICMVSQSLYKNLCGFQFNCLQIFEMKKRIKDESLRSMLYCYKNQIVIQLLIYLLVNLLMQKQSRDSSSAKTDIPSFYSETKLLTVEQFQNGRAIQKCSIGKYRYSKQDLLGQGFSSTVYKATLIDNKKQRFAIKVIDLSKFQDNQIDLLETEIEIIRSLNHPNIIKCVDVYKTEANYFLVTEYCPHGDLSELIKIQKSITEDRAIPIMRQILEGYKYLMSKNIIHRDLKPANIMRFTGDWKIGDFGFAKYCKQQFVLEKLYVGTPLYMPPQSLQLNKYSYKSDIFALGIILYEMLTGQTPWAATDVKQLLDAIKQTKLQIPQGIVSEQIKQFLKKSIEIDYYTRMNKEQFKKFTLQNIDVDKIAKVRPGRGMSPGLRRQLSKSGKKSFLFVTPIKSSKNPHFQFSASRHTNQVQSSKNYQKYPLQIIKNNLMGQYGLQGSPIDTKIFKQNSDIISNQTDLVKVMVNFVNQSEVLILEEQDRKFICVFMYRVGLKILRMVSNSRQNTYKFSKWDIYRKSDKYLTQISIVNSYTNKVENQYGAYKKNIQPLIITQFHKQFPELQVSGSISFKVFARLYEKLRKFVKQKITDNRKQVLKQNIAQYCYSIKLLMNIISALKSRTTRQQQIMGFGLKVKPDSLLLKNISWSGQAMRLSLKQLDLMCQYRVQLE